MYLALYRKFRPTTFEEVVGQEHISTILKNQIKAGRIGHAYLFTGPRGTGKTSFAKIFARAVNCTASVNGSPCGSCEICRENLDNIDIIEIDAASNNRVEEVRDLKEKTQLAPTFARYKVYIIDEVHMLSASAFNALLKTLEEPPEYVIFVLATTEVQKLPATILSRCMRFDFRLLETNQIASHIANLYNKVGFKATSDAIYALAKAGDGSMRDALSVADLAMGITDGELTKADVESVLGGTVFDSIFNLSQCVLLKNNEKALEIFQRLLKEGKTTGMITKDLITFLRELLWCKITGENQDRKAEEEFARMKNICGVLTSEQIAGTLEIFVEAENKYRYSQNPRILFEMAVFATSNKITLQDLIKRVEKLEKVIHNENVDNSSSFPQSSPRQC
ncbi:MAG: DNA polymerase III subunit gamma/tau [Bacillota bacterium]